MTTPTKDRRAEAEGWGNRPDAFQPKWDMGRDQYGKRIYALDGLIAACHFATGGPADREFDDDERLEHWGTVWLSRLQNAQPTDWIPGTPEERLGLLKVAHDFIAYEETIGDFGGWDEYASDTSYTLRRDECDQDCLDRWLVYEAAKSALMSLNPAEFEPRVRTWTVVDSRRSNDFVCICGSQANAQREAERLNHQAYSQDRYSVVPGEPI